MYTIYAVQCTLYNVHRTPYSVLVRVYNDNYYIFPLYCIHLVYIIRVHEGYSGYTIYIDLHVYIYILYIDIYVSNRE